MNIIKICNTLFANRELRAKRKSWENEMIAIYEKGWASQYERTEPSSEEPRDFFIQHIKDNRLLGEGYPSLVDIMAEDWEIIYPIGKSIVDYHKFFNPIINGTKLYIGVISKNSEDFLNWKRENNLTGKHRTPKLFYTKDNKTYVCFATICDTKSWSIDELLETNLAKSNKDYEQIKLVASQQLS